MCVFLAVCQTFYRVIQYNDMQYKFFCASCFMHFLRIMKLHSTYFCRRSHCRWRCCCCYCNFDSQCSKMLRLRPRTFKLLSRNLELNELASMHPYRLNDWQSYNCVIHGRGIGSVGTNSRSSQGKHQFNIQHRMNTRITTTTREKKQNNSSKVWRLNNVRIKTGLMISIRLFLCMRALCMCRRIRKMHGVDETLSCQDVFFAQCSRKQIWVSFCNWHNYLNCSHMKWREVRWR